MSFQSHGNNEDLVKRFMEQTMPGAERRYPEGRMGALDEGQIAYAMANDDRNRTIIIRFPRPVTWVGLGLRDAEELMQQLSERIAVLRGIPA